MAPKDIRSFFGGLPSKSDGGAQKRPGTDDGGQAAKKPKLDASAKPAAKPKAKASPKAKAKASPSKPVRNKMVITPKQPAAKPAAPSADGQGASAGRKRAAPSKSKKEDDLEDDFDDDGMDIDDDKVIALDDSDDDLEVVPAPKARGRSTPASARATAKPDGEGSRSKSATPAAAKKPAARALPSSLEKPARAPKSKAAKVAPPPLGANAEKAIAAVDAAMRALPPEDDLKISRMQATEGGFGGGGNADSLPPRHGEKDAPEGHPDALTGKTFVISGVLDSLTRSEAEDFIKRHGGRTTVAVSGKTTFLLCGESTGNSKYKAAKDKNVKLIDEDGLFALVSASAPFAPPRPEAPAQRSGAASFYGGAAVASTSGAGRSQAPTPLPTVPRGGELWVDKWKPKNASELVGNPGHLTTLRQWLRDWHHVHVLGVQPAPPPGAAGKKEGAAKKDMGKKAIMMSGPPGIGKTTTAHIICKELGFDVVEVNASDTRNKSDSKTKNGIDGKLSNRIKELVTNTAIGAGDGHTNTRKQVIVMDEVDGMSGGDRGGIGDLILSIKASKLPIICICNDKYKQSLKSLRNHCLELEWRRPTKQQVAARLSRVCQAEGLSLNASAMDALAEQAQGDMRMMLGQLQMARLAATSLSYDDLKRATRKDTDISPFEVSRRLLSTESATLSIADRMDLMFQDLDLVPLLVQENYLNHRPQVASNEAVALQVYAKAADAISMGDTVNKRVRMNQEWALSPFAGFMSTVYPGAYVRGHRQTFGLYPSEPNFPRFTAWMGNNSSSTKWRRLCGELNTKLLAANVVTDRRDVRLQYLPVLRHALTLPLVRDGDGGIAPVISLMQQYLISREDFDTIVDVTSFKTKAPWGGDPRKSVATNVKSSFTRSFNKEGLPVKTSIMVEEFKKGKGKGKAAKKAAVVDDDLEEDGDHAEGTAAVKVEEEEEDEEVDVKQLTSKGFFFKEAATKGAKKPAAASKSRAKPAAKGSKAAGKGGKAGK